MKKCFFSGLLLSILLLLVLPAWAQENTLLHFMNTTPQAMRSNPANLPDSAMSMFFGVPFLSNISVGATAPLSWSDVFSRRGDSLYVKPDVNNYFSDGSRLSADFNYELFSFGKRLNEEHFITAGLAVKGYGDIGIPADAVTLFVKGNTAFMNSPCIVDMSAYALTYAELSLGYAYKVDNNWTVGGRFKVLGGLAGVYSESITASLHTDPQSYNLLANSNILIKTSRYNNDGNVLKTLENIFDNMGMGFDAGVYYKTPIHGLEVGLSLIDWGFISWGAGISYYEGKKNNIPLSFNGLEHMGTNDDVITTLLDTLESQFQVDEVDGNSFTTKLPGRVILSAAYNFTRNDKLGVLFKTNALQNFERTGITLMYNRLVGDWLSVSLGNNFLFSQKLFNPSLAVNFTVSTLQIYIAAENITSLYVKNMRGAGLQFGMAIIL
jgi:hypothetical protein